MGDQPSNEAVVSIAGLRTLVVEPKDRPQLVAVMLHGYAMVPDGLSPFARSIGVPARFFVPEGPCEARPTGRAWWDMDLDARARALASGPRDLSLEHPPGAAAARARLVAFLREGRGLWGALPLILIGFSQGGMLACDTFFRERIDVAGLALLSSTRIMLDEWVPLASRARGLPVFVSHGERDADLAFSAGEGLRDFFRGAGAHVTWVRFDEGHEIPLVVWRGLRKFLDQLRRAT